MLVFIAVIICLFNCLALGFELKSFSQGVIKSPRFYAGAFAFIATLFFIYFANGNQQKENMEKAGVAAKQSVELEKMQSKSDLLLETQKSQYEKQEVQQKAQLEKAQNLLKTQVEEKASLNKVIDSQHLNIELLNRLTLNHNLLGIEISFAPSPERWTNIVASYRRIKSPEPDVSYAEAAMTAERDGDHWRIDFAPVNVKPRVVQTARGPMTMGGNKKFPRRFTVDEESKAFENVLGEALLGLRIEWGNGTSTTLETTQKDFPSAMYVSRDRISYVLRPPLVLWNLNEMRDLSDQDKAIVTFYGKDYPLALPTRFTIRSLDPAVVLNQTLDLNWRSRERSASPSYDIQMNRQVSGPHTLRVEYRYVEAVYGKRHQR